MHCEDRRVKLQRKHDKNDTVQSYLQVIAVNEFGQEIPAFTDVQRIPQPKDMKGGSVCISDRSEMHHDKLASIVVVGRLLHRAIKADPICLTHATVRLGMPDLATAHLGMPDLATAHLGMPDLAHMGFML